MNDLPSDWEWYWKLFAIVLFAAIMAGLAWFFRHLVYDWLPPALVPYLFVALMAFASGYLLGQRSVIRIVKKRWGYDPRDGG